MAAARWWRERRRDDELRERREAVARNRPKHLLLPLEETSSGVGLDADTDSAGTALPTDSPWFGGVSSSGEDAA